MKGKAKAADTRPQPRRSARSRHPPIDPSIPAAAAIKKTKAEAAPVIPAPAAPAASTSSAPTVVNRKNTNLPPAGSTDTLSGRAGPSQPRGIFYPPDTPILPVQGLLKLEEYETLNAGPPSSSSPLFCLILC